MTRRNDNLRSFSRADHRTVRVTAGTGFSAPGLAKNCLALLVIVLSAVAGCGHPVPATPLEKAQLEFDTRHWDGAIAACNEAIAKDPEDSAAFLLRGRAQHLAGRLDQAVADLTEAIRLNPRDPEPYYQRANAYQALGQMDLKDEDNVSARTLDPKYTRHIKTEVPLSLDPLVIEAESEADSAKSPSGSGKKPAHKEKKSDDDAIDLSKETGAQPKRSVVEDMLGLPTDILDQDRLTPSGARPKEPTTRGRTPPVEPDEPAAKPDRSGRDLGAGRATKSTGRLGATDRSQPRPGVRAGLAGGKEPAAMDDRRGQSAATGQQGASSAYRNLHPFGPSSMRPTGMKDPASSFVDPRTGLPFGKGRAATVGTPYVPPLPYSPMSQTQGSGSPARPLFTPPPGNRYDGGRGY